jgi:hypothetical protein
VLSAQALSFAQGNSEEVRHPDRHDVADRSPAAANDTTVNVTPSRVAL